VVSARKSHQSGDFDHTQTLGDKSHASPSSNDEMRAFECHRAPENDTEKES